MKESVLFSSERQSTPIFYLGLFASARLHAKAKLHLWGQRNLQRQRLATLSAHELEDIGLTESERFTESSKPFWRA